MEKKKEPKIKIWSTIEPEIDKLLEDAARKDRRTKPELIRIIIEDHFKPQRKGKDK